MGEYRVTAPCTYVKDGRAVMHLHAGAFVELTEDEAAPVADCVQFIDRSGRAAEPESADVIQLPQQPVVEVPEEIVAELNSEATEVEVDKPTRRRRGESDG